MIGELRATYPVERVCTVLDCPRSSYYYQAVPSEQTALVEAVEQLLLRKPFFG